MRCCTLIATLLLASAAVARDAEPPDHPSVELPPELARVLTDYETAWQAMDAHALAYAVEDSRGYIIGDHARHRSEPNVGKFTLTLRRAADGRWLIMSDMDNGNWR